VSAAIDTCGVDDLAFGAVVRAVRTRRKLSQQALAELAGVSHGTISLIERGHSEKLSLAVLRRIAGSLEVRVDLNARWRGGELERLLSRRHSLLAERVAAFLTSFPGWAVDPEVSFSVYGERGIIDQLAWHEATCHLLVIELKTEFVDVNETIGTLDRKHRLAATVAASRGWRPTFVSVWLIVADSATNRRHGAEHRTLLRSRFTADGRRLRGFLECPSEPTAGLAFWPDANPRSSRSTAQPSGSHVDPPVGRLAPNRSVQ
jgi:transcriptional regulator with XRE-family HTH domain